MNSRDFGFEGAVPLNGASAAVDDRALVAQAKCGCSIAFGNLYERHWLRLFRCTFRILRNREDAEDAVQRSFHRAFTSLGQFREDSTFSTWITSIAMNEALMCLRQRRPLSSLSQYQHDDVIEFQKLDIADKASDPRTNSRGRRVALPGTSQSKESKEIVLQDATQPIISRDGKHVMYITLPAPQKSELWVSDIDGGNKVKIATGEVLLTGLWAPDNFHLSFGEYRTSAGDKAYIVGADGSGRRLLPPTGGMPLSIWSPDEKTIYVSSLQNAEPTSSIWKWSVDSSNPEKIIDSCGDVADADPSGQYLLSSVSAGEKTGIYEVSIADRKCIQLLSGIVTFLPAFARDGKSFLYAVASRDEVTIFRQPWTDGKLNGAAQVALKVPFAFPLDYAGGNTYDFSRDLSTIVYARPGGHADLYLLSRK